jgi:hypothetical protein
MSYFSFPTALSQSHAACPHRSRAPGEPWSVSGTWVLLPTQPAKQERALSSHWLLQVTTKTPDSNYKPQAMPWETHGWKSLSHGVIILWIVFSPLCHFLFLSFKNKILEAGRVTQAVERLLSKHEALSSSPQAAKNKWTNEWMNF